MKKYIGVKLVDAEPGEAPAKLGLPYGTQGMDVVYRDGYKSWCPKNIFEAQNVGIGKHNTVTQEDVDNMIGDVLVKTIGGKTTFVQVMLRNGFTLEETSSCVDPANYNEGMGVDICMAKIKDKIWYLLEFLLQSALYGFNHVKPNPLLKTTERPGL
ncbi:MAG: hypothetical protein JEZ12_16015 [Desulfobacterium sp.]|nr:hypothetical protein [Desulfobacterium sp.]